MAQAQPRNAFFIDIRTDRPVSNSVSQVQPEHYMTVTMLHHEVDVCFAGMDAGEAAVLRILWHLEDAVQRTGRKHTAFYFRFAFSEVTNGRSKTVCLPHL